MPKEFSRTLRLGEQVHRVLSQLISRELKDPRIGMVTISEVEMTPDLSLARVYYTVLGNDADRAASAKALAHARGFLRSQLGKAMHTRVTPDLQFIYDATEEEGARLETLIVAARRKDTSGNPGDEG